MMAVDVDDRILRAWDRMLVDNERGAGRVLLNGQSRLIGASLTTTLGFWGGTEEGGESKNQGNCRHDKPNTLHHVSSAARATALHHRNTRGTSNVRRADEELRDLPTLDRRPTTHDHPRLKTLDPRPTTIPQGSAAALP